MQTGGAEQTCKEKKLTIKTICWDNYAPQTQRRSQWKTSLTTRRNLTDPQHEDINLPKHSSGPVRKKNIATQRASRPSSDNEQTHHTQRSEQKTHSEQRHREMSAHRKVHKGVGADERRTPQDKNEAKPKENERRHVEADQRRGGVGGRENWSHIRVKRQTRVISNSNIY